LIENFIKHEKKEVQSGPDLSSAWAMRDEYYAVLKAKMDCNPKHAPEIAADITRIWIKKS